MQAQVPKVKVVKSTLMKFLMASTAVIFDLNLICQMISRQNYLGCSPNNFIRFSQDWHSCPKFWLIQIYLQI